MLSKVATETDNIMNLMLEGGELESPVTVNKGDTYAIHRGRIYIERV